jgi:hypothetical protein
MGIYGESLLHFPEQFRSISYFDQTPKFNDGWNTAIPIGTIRGIIQNKTSGVKDQNGLIVRNIQYYLWTLTSARVAAGKFIDFQSDVYRIIIDNDWPTEDGFYSYELEKVVGSDGVNVTTVTVTDGSANF